MNSMRGFVKLRRSIIEHTETGKMSCMELGVYAAMILQADHKTGVWIGNAPELSKLVGVERRTATRLIANLKNKGYIECNPRAGFGGQWYEITINKYGENQDTRVPTDRKVRTLESRLPKPVRTKTSPVRTKTSPVRTPESRPAPQAVPNEEVATPKKEELRTVYSAENASYTERGTAATPPVPVVSPPIKHELAVIWQQEHGKLPGLRTLTSDRLKKCRDRMKAHADDPNFLADFRAAVQLAARNAFLNGKNDRHWRATFDWFVKNDSIFEKVLEGAYGDGNRNHAQGETDVERRIRENLENLGIASRQDDKGSVGGTFPKFS